MHEPADSEVLAGSYTGKICVRPGMEDALAKVEKKLLGKVEASLELKRDGSFLFKKTTKGAYRRIGNKILLEPKEFNGATLTSMRSAAESAGRDFGLSWLFEPFELKVEGESLESVQGATVLYIEYTRSKT